MCAQVYSYMDAYQSWHGFLTSCTHTVFLWRSPDEPDILQFSPPYLTWSENLTVLQALYYLLHTERQMQTTHSKPPRLGMAR